MPKITAKQAVDQLSAKLQDVSAQVGRLSDQNTILIIAISRVIAKIDPDNLYPQGSPERLKESLDMVQPIIDKMLAEENARRHTMGLELLNTKDVAWLSRTHNDRSLTPSTPVSTEPKPFSPTNRPLATKTTRQ